MNAPYTPLLETMREANAQAFQFTIRGEPVAKGRPRLSTIGGRARAFTPAKTRRYEEIVRLRATEAWSAQPLAGVAVTMRVTVFRQIPQSWPRKRREAALLGTVRPIGRPDADNFAKAILDGLNGVVLRDDALVVDLHVQKFYGVDPRCEVAITW